MNASFEEQLWVLLIQAGCPVHIRVDARVLLRTAVEEEREACCRDVCPQCRDGRPLDKSGLNHTAKQGGTILLPVGPCAAASIRARASNAT